MNKLKPEFVDFIPVDLDNGKLYVSLKYCTAVHLCACGCGEKVVTPLRPDGWKLYFDGTVTLRPSIGNFEFQCQSHYYITENMIEWLPADNMSDKSIKKRKRQKKRKKFKFKRTFPFFTII